MAYRATPKRMCLGLSTPSPSSVNETPQSEFRISTLSPTSSTPGSESSSSPFSLDDVEFPFPTVNLHQLSEVHGPIDSQADQKQQQQQNTAAVAVNGAALVIGNRRSFSSPTGIRSLSSMFSKLTTTQIPGQPGFGTPHSKGYTIQRTPASGSKRPLATLTPRGSTERYLGTPVSRGSTSSMSSLGTPASNNSVSTPSHMGLGLGTPASGGSGRLLRRYTPPSMTGTPGVRRGSAELIEYFRSKPTMASPMPSSKGNTLTPAGAQMKVVPRRPSKRGSISHARKLSMTDFGSDDSSFSSPKPKKKMTRRFSDTSAIVTFRMRSSTLTVMSSVDSIRKLTDAMVSRGVKMLAIDWDLTMVSCHTRSQWYGTAEELGRHVRPVFRKLIIAAVASGLNIAVVSFSAQHKLILGALAEALPTIDTSAFAVRCSDKSWNLPEKALREVFPGASSESQGKLTHLCSAVQQLCLSDKENGLKILPKEIVFIDDDENNITDAHKHKVQAIWMDPRSPDMFLHTLEQRFLRP